MRNIKDELNLNQKKVLLRLDLNVPLNNRKITDTTRIDKILPTINFLLKNNAKVIILSHVGRPKGKVVNELSLKPICESLKNKLNLDIRLISKNIKEVRSSDLFSTHDEKIVILENPEQGKVCSNTDTNNSLFIFFKSRPFKVYATEIIYRG